MKSKYIIITPAHNEEKYIEDVIKSIVSQTLKPERWLIVNDRSTDKTGEIIDTYKEKYSFIEHYYLKQGELYSYYARRTNVFLAGYEKVKNENYDFIAALDADLLLPPDYYENIIKELNNNSNLGIATGVYVDKIGDKCKHIDRSNQSTPGGLQMFRRECYEKIGGYIPLKYGGDDSLADIMTRLNGWETRSYSDFKAIHLRPVGCRGGTSIFKARYRQGMTDYNIGTGILFMLAKSLRRAFVESPYVLGSMLRLMGYLRLWLINEKREAPKDVVTYLKKEQIQRLFTLSK